LSWKSEQIKRLNILHSDTIRTHSTSTMAESTSIPKQALTVYEDELIEACLSSRPSTPGETIARLKAGALSTLSKDNFVSALLSTKAAATIVKTAVKVQRVSLVTTADSEIRLVPLHGIETEWKQVNDPILHYWTEYPGFVSSKSGPKISNEALCKAQRDTTLGKPLAMDLTCIADSKTSDNLFAKIIRGELEQWRLWETDSHIAFLTPFGNTYGKTVLIPRKHLDSDILSLPDDDFSDLAGAVWDMIQVIMRSDVGADRVGLIFEGMEIDWAHAKLIPIRGDDGRQPTEQPFMEKYGGSVSSQPGPLATGEDLQEILSKFQSIAT
jgi:beta-aspartyl-peptidase (threonine type)